MTGGELFGFHDAFCDSVMSFSAEQMLRLHSALVVCLDIITNDLLVLCSDFVQTCRKWVPCRDGGIGVRRIPTACAKEGDVEGMVSGMRFSLRSVCGSLTSVKHAALKLRGNLQCCRFECDFRISEH